MRTTLRSVIAALALLASAASAAPHHSFSLEYDLKKPIAFEGVVTKVEWTNPHARIYVDVVDAAGAVHTWNLELASLSALVRNGWTRTSVKAGERVKVEGYEGRGTNTYRANATAIVTADGASLFSGAAEDRR
jgi:hypothetical protein